jgi:nucleoid-associated protein YgaU
MRDISKLLIVGSTAILVLCAVFWMLYIDARSSTEEARHPSNNHTSVDATPPDTAGPPPPGHANPPAENDLPPPLRTAELPEDLQLPADLELPRDATLHEIAARYYRSVKLHDGASVTIPREQLPAITRRLAGHNGIDPQATISAGTQISLPRVYIVGPRDTLARIAHKLYGDGRRWHDIYNLNADLIQNPNKIKPGWVLLLPKKR